MTQFLILVAFGCMVWAVGVTILHITARREVDQVKRDAKENAERVKFYSDYCNRKNAEIRLLEKENANLSCNLLLSRNYVQRLRMEQGRRYIEANEVQR